MLTFCWGFQKTQGHSCWTRTRLTVLTKCHIRQERENPPVNSLLISLAQRCVWELISQQFCLCCGLCAERQQPSLSKTKTLGSCLSASADVCGSILHQRLFVSLQHELFSRLMQRTDQSSAAVILLWLICRIFLKVRTFPLVLASSKACSWDQNQVGVRG